MRKRTCLGEASWREKQRKLVEVQGSTYPRARPLKAVCRRQAACIAREKRARGRQGLHYLPAVRWERWGALFGSWVVDCPNFRKAPWMGMEKLWSMDLGKTVLRKQQKNRRKNGNRPSSGYSVPRNVRVQEDLPGEASWREKQRKLVEV